MKDVVIYDFKSTSFLSTKEYPPDYHLDQVLIYCAATGSKYWSLVYIAKNNMESLQHYGSFDATSEGRVRVLFDKCQDVYQKFLNWKQHGGDIPFQKCGCYFCQNEKLNTVTLPQFVITEVPG